MTPEPPKPELCPTCAALVESSNLHWRLCGGMTVGLHRQPLTWRLRDKNENAMVEQRTKDLRKLAAAMRLLCEAHKHLPEPLAGAVARFCNIGNIASSTRRPAADP